MSGVMLLTLAGCEKTNEELASEPAAAAEAAVLEDGSGDPDSTGGGGNGLGLGLDNVDMGTADLEQLDCPTIMQGDSETADIVGVTVGMSATMAYQRIACSNPALTVTMTNEAGFEMPRLPDGTKPMSLIKADGGQEEFTVWLAGKPNEERVIALRRELTFGSGHEPPTSTLVQQLADKYGTLTVNRYNGDEGGVVRTADNRLLTDNSNTLFSRCLPDDRGSISINDTCGLSVGVAVKPKRENKDLVDKLTVTITHGKYGQRLLGEYRDFAANAEAQQRQSELEAAEQRATTDAPAL
ncbi:MAG: hypothetical protein AAF636_21280 [Pseudomonadota bacterium]